jgi:hypothetical protein
MSKLLTGLAAIGFLCLVASPAPAAQSRADGLHQAQAGTYEFSARRRHWRHRHWRHRHAYWRPYPYYYAYNPYYRPYYYRPAPFPFFPFLFPW